MEMIKRGTKLCGLKPELCIAHTIVSLVFLRYGYPAIITEGLGGQHGPHSHHLKGLALDFRRRHIKTLDEVRTISNDLAQALGDNYQVVLEDTHFHVEFDPK